MIEIASTHAVFMHVAEKTIESEKGVGEYPTTLT
jgi:hypothetical protein